MVNVALATGVVSAEVLTLIVSEPANVLFVAVAPLPATTVRAVEAGIETGVISVTLFDAVSVGVTETDVLSTV